MRFKRGSVIESIVPFKPEEASPKDGLFDDCPMCLELRAMVEAGEAEEVFFDEDDEAEEDSGRPKPPWIN